MSSPWDELAPKNNRCSHAGCHVRAVKIIGYQPFGIGMRIARGYSCGNHGSDKPTHLRDKDRCFDVEGLY